MIHLKVRPDGSNLEDALQSVAGRLVAGGTCSRQLIAASQPLEYSRSILVEGTILLDDVGDRPAMAGRKRQRAIRQRASSERLALSGRCRARSCDRRTAPRRLPPADSRFRCKPATADATSSRCKPMELSLAVAEPWLRRFVAPGELSGTLSGQGTRQLVERGGGRCPSDLTSTGTLSIDRLDATAPAWPAIAFDWRASNCPGESRRSQAAWTIEDLQLRSDVGQVAVRGRLDPQRRARRSTILNCAARSTWPRLAAMLPHALRIREDTTITSGTIELAGQLPAERRRPADHRFGPHARNWPPRAAGKACRWDQPVNANFAMRRTGSALQLDSLQCDSKFLQIEAAGTPQQLAANASFDLNAWPSSLASSSTSAACSWPAPAAPSSPGSNRAPTNSPPRRRRPGAAGRFAGRWRHVGRAAACHSRRSRRLARSEVRIGRRASMRPSCKSTAKATRSTRSSPARLALTERRAGVARHDQGDRQHRPLAHARAALVRARSDGKSTGRASSPPTFDVAGNAFEATKTKLVVTNLRATAPGLEHQRTARRIRRRCPLGRRDGRSCRQLGPACDEHRLAGDAGRALLRGRAGHQSARRRGRVPSRPRAARRVATPANEPAPYQAKGEFTGNIRFAQQGDRITGEMNATGQNLALASLSKPERAAASPPPVTKPSGKNRISPSAASPATNRPPTASLRPIPNPIQHAASHRRRARSKNSPPSPK